MVKLFSYGKLYFISGCLVHDPFSLVRVKGLSLTRGFYLRVWEGQAGRAFVATSFTPPEKPNLITRNVDLCHVTVKIIFNFMF